ncbi:sporulation protein [Caldimonas tepidiphila]|uniref:sporulation protein n=1 Tax=Caldimonas tepidiphila TaxID=2315841 RepID=UPI000E5A8C63|nr:sporulation protein [Caldimonas tepidiphila]
MFRKLLSSMGIGAATVDLQLENALVSPGGSFRGQVVARGGSTPQAVSGLTIALLTRVEVETGNGEVVGKQVLDSWKLPASFTLQPQETKVVPVHCAIGAETPLTELSCRDNRTRVWLQTGLEIDLGLDPGDEDFLRIVPTSAQAAFLSAMELAGFQMMRADVEKGYLQGRGFRSRSGCYQELEYRPVGAGRWSINEVEVSFVPETERTHVLLEIDRAFRRDGYLSLTLDHRALDARAIARELERLIR